MKQFLVNALIFLLKIANWLKIIISQLFLLIFKIIQTIFRFLFYKILIQLYYLIFRLKRYEIKEKGINTFFQQKAIHGLAIFLSFTLIFFSLSTKSQASTYAQKMKNSLMAQAVMDDLEKLNQETLITQESLIDKNINELNTRRYKDEKEFNESLTQVNETVDTPVSFNDFSINRKQVSIEQNTITPDSVVSSRTETIEYEVQTGDTVSAIAQKFNLKVNTILWANNLSAFSLIRPGNKLTILPTDGILHTVSRNETIGAIANLYGVDNNQISEYNDISGDIISINQKLIIPGALKKAPSPVRPVASTPKAPSIPTINSNPSTAASIPSDGRMAWPTQGHRITQYYSWRHTGLDIANKTGTPIYAAEAGTIEFSGWSTGYGNNIIINHGGGKKTRYAHMTEMYVRVGQQVAKGAHIAAMGSTGWSTGPHIHFEVIINGVKQNPLNYIR
jgi:murein DD-endopeptidase MepM/ murein hydrolase activator NlpD